MNSLKMANSQSLYLYFLFLLTQLVAVPQLAHGVKVSDAPKLLGILDELNISEGVNTTIFCSIAAGDLRGLTYEWYKDKEKIAHATPSSRIKVDVPLENYQSVLRIFDLKPTDSALYTCVAKNKFGQDKISTKLNVQVQLKWIVEPTDLQVSAGKPAHVPCQADGIPAPVIEWRKLLDDNADQDNNNKYGENSAIIGRELSFLAAEPRHSGVYECRASVPNGSENNGEGEELRRRIRLTVLGKYEVGT